MTHTKDEALKLEALVKEEMRYYHDGHYLDSSDAKYQLLSFAHRISKSVRASTPPAQEFVCSTGLCHYKPAAPVQPVASLKEADVLMIAEAHNIDPRTKGLYGFYIDCISSQPAAQPAPVHFAWMRYEEDCAGDPVLVLSRSAEEGAFRVYKEPAQGQWVGLTDDEVRKINQEVWGYVSADHTRMRGYAHAIEAKLKEKNT